MTAMLNRFNKATVLIGTGKDGRAIGDELSEKDVDTVLEIMSARINRMPDVRVTLESDGDGRYIMIRATGYETPYAFDGWFYTRKRAPTGDGFAWKETLTCGMKRHRRLCSNNLKPSLSELKPRQTSSMHDLGEQFQTVRDQACNAHTGVPAPMRTQEQIGHLQGREHQPPHGRQARPHGGERAAVQDAEGERIQEDPLRPHSEGGVLRRAGVPHGRGVRRVHGGHNVGLPQGQHQPDADGLVPPISRSSCCR